MMGMFRLVVAGRTRVVQLMTVTEEEPGVVLSLNHFTPQLRRWEREIDPLQFLLTELTRVRAVFNCLTPQESLPEQMIYQQPNRDTLTIEYRSRGETTAVVHLTRLRD